MQFKEAMEFCDGALQGNPSAIETSFAWFAKAQVLISCLAVAEAAASLQRAAASLAAGTADWRAAVLAIDIQMALAAVALAQGRYDDARSLYLQSADAMRAG